MAMDAAVWDSVETASRDELAALQSERLRDCVARVGRRVPFYQARLADAGIGPGDVASLDAGAPEGLAALPFTRKQDLRDHYPYGLFAVPMDEVVRLHASSGTTGQLTVVGYTAADLALWSDLAARALTMAGVGRGDIVHNAYGYGLFTGGLGLHYGIERVGAAAVPVSAGNTRRQCTLLRDFGATVLCCTPSYALLLAEQLAADGASPGGSPLADSALPDSGASPGGGWAGGPLRVGVFGAEPWSERMRGEIESRLQITALDIYGLSEVLGPAVAMECFAKDGLHLAEDHFLPEIIDPATGRPLPDGETGELTLTCMTKEALPLLRYRTGDLTSLRRDRCACGRTTARMAKPLGRTDDMLIVRGVNVFPSQIEAALLGVAGLEPQYELLLERRGALDELTVRIEATEPPDAVPHAGPGEAPDAAGLPPPSELERRAAAELQSVLGLSCRVSALPRGAIARSEGKAVRVIDRRPK